MDIQGKLKDGGTWTYSAGVRGNDIRGRLELNYGEGRVARVKVDAPDVTTLTRIMDSILVDIRV